MGELKASEDQGVVIITASGKLITETDKQSLRDLISASLDDGKRAFVVDTRDAWLNSTMLGGLIGAYKTIDKENGRMVLVIPPPRGLGPLIRVFDYYFSVEEAVAALTEQ